MSRACQNFADSEMPGVLWAFIKVLWSAVYKIDTEETWAIWQKDANLFSFMGHEELSIGDDCDHRRQHWIFNHLSCVVF